MHKFTEIQAFYQIARTVKKTNATEEVPDEYKVTGEVTYRGTVKLHGTNAGVLCTSDNLIPQSRSRELTIQTDNAGFAAFVLKNQEQIREIEAKVRTECSLDSETPIVLYGEWCGEGIQKGVAINKLPKMWVLFSVKLVGESSNRTLDYIPSLGNSYDEQKIYSIIDGPTWNVTVDFNSDESKKKAIEYAEAETEKVEQCCPWAKRFDVEGLGEGIVWMPLGEYNFRKTDLAFKTKGDKHKVVNEKVKAKIDPEKLANVSEFVDFAVTENRLEQGLSHLKEMNIPFEMKSIGAFLKWMNQDVTKECSEELVESGLTWNDVKREVSSKSRNFFIAKVKEG